MQFHWKLFAASCAATAAFGTAASETSITPSVTLEDLDNLYTKLSTSAVPRPVDRDAWLKECAYHIMKPDYVNANPGEPDVDDKWVLTDYFYKNAPAGACTMKLPSAFGMSWNYTLKQVFDDFFEGIEPGSKELDGLRMEGIVDSLPELTLPSFMVEPTTAKDAVEVVQFAKTHGLQVSVKNTGHDYAGQSDVKNSFQLNMRNFPTYSATDIVPCTEDNKNSFAPCKLAFAKGSGILDYKNPAVVRVSGSEGNDSIYKSVRDWNHQMPREQRYQVSGGGEGAVGAGGGYTMGGGLGIGATDRRWGIAIDQVLEMEMVLANGQHVKFGPSEWDFVEGYIYPQTTKVTGYCNKNVHHLQEKWEWGECDVDINFEDLWFAARGGGGGTWGVLISTWMQLHKETDGLVAYIDGDIQDAINEASCDSDDKACLDEIEEIANKMWTDFYIDFFFKPKNETFGSDENDKCGTDSDPFAGIPLSAEKKGLLMGVACLEKSAADKFIKSWKNYVPTSKYLWEGANVDLLQKLFSMQSMGGMWGDVLLRLPLIGTDKAMSANNTFALSDAADSAQNPNSFMKTPAGHAWSQKTAGAYSPYMYNLLIPTEMVLEKSDLVFDLLRKVCGGSHYWGGNAAISSDGMDSMNKSFRISQLGCQFGLDDVKGVNTYEELDAYYSKVQSKIMEFVSEDDKKNNIFPGIQEKNHVQGNTPLPLKDDWTKVCPYDLPTEERKEKCMSVQESIWGTENMERMEKIKKELDPDNMFQVYIGIGQRDVSQQQEYKWPTQLPENYTPVSVSYNSGADSVVKDDDDDSSGNRRHLRGQN